jgi:hypothetical protein
MSLPSGSASTQIRLVVSWSRQVTLCSHQWPRASACRSSPFNASSASGPVNLGALLRNKVLMGVALSISQCSPASSARSAWRTSARRSRESAGGPTHVDQTTSSMPRPRSRRNPRRTHSFARACRTARFLQSTHPRELPRLGERAPPGMVTRPGSIVALWTGERRYSTRRRWRRLIMDATDAVCGSELHSQPVSSSSLWASHLCRSVPECRDTRGQGAQRPSRALLRSSAVGQGETRTGACPEALSTTPLSSAARTLVSAWWWPGL